MHNQIFKVSKTIPTGITGKIYKFKKIPVPKVTSRLKIIRFGLILTSNSLQVSIIIPWINQPKSFIMKKKNQTFTNLLLIILVLCTITLKAEIKLPAIFGDHMVLQQNTNASIWGKATPRQTVQVVTSWESETYSTKSDKEGNWKLKVKTPTAG
ncbi:MAG: hypothetical protein KAK04_08940, partial [Cyclobacteriaceae bacterium]|nr:hypothetical protein [Cyclobacteriaceae bacterium]